MEDNFRSSFIPKQPLVNTGGGLGQQGTPYRAPRSSEEGTSLLMTVALIILFFVGIAYGGLFLFERTLLGQIEDMSEELEMKRQAFKPAEIAELKRFDDKLTLASSLINNHIVTSEVFKLLGSLTHRDVQFTDFNLLIGDGEVSRGAASVVLTLEGQSSSFESIAYQIGRFRSNPYIKSSSFSGFDVDNETYLVQFTANLTLDPSLIRYTDALKRNSGALPVVPRETGVEGDSGVLSGNEEEVSDNEGIVESGEVSEEAPQEDAAETMSEDVNEALGDNMTE